MKVDDRISFDEAELEALLERAADGDAEAEEALLRASEQVLADLAGSSDE